MASKRLAKKQAKKQNITTVPTAAPIEKAADDSSVKEMPVKKERSFIVHTYLQYDNQEVSQQEIIDRIKEEWCAQGHNPEDLEELSLYLKPQDGMVYYVINKSIHGQLNLF